MAESVIPPAAPPVEPPAVPPVAAPAEPAAPNTAELAAKLTVAQEEAKDAFMARDAARAVAQTRETEMNDLKDQITAAELAQAAAGRRSKLIEAAAATVDPAIVADLLEGKEGEPAVLVATLLAEKPYLGKSGNGRVADLVPPAVSVDPYQSVADQIRASRG